MRRKYDLRNKRNFVIILILSIAVIAIFSLFIYKYKKASVIAYPIVTDSIVQDDNKNYIDITEDAALKIRWNGNYYLEYQDKKINLSKRVIVYNKITGEMKLYGKFFEIDKTGKIIENKDETILKNTTNTKFYKLDDRKYLLVDRKIYSDDRSIDASNYLLVELDKMGNAKLSNNKLNMKTIAPTTLVTSEYSFDIANEILKYGAKNIDLKKIIGSTNQFVPEEEKVPEEEQNSQNNTDNNANGTNGGTNGDGASGNGGEGNSGVAGNGNSGSGGGGFDITEPIGEKGDNAGNVINNTDTGDVTDIGEIKDKTKMTSIIRAQESLTQIDVDYVVYDPYNEYKSIYAEIVKSGKVDVVYLSKTDTHIVFDKLEANTEYKINFIYTTVVSETGEVIPTTFDSLTLKTRMPKYSISVYKVSNVNNTLTYRVYLQEGYTISKVNVSLLFKNRVFNTETGDSILVDEHLFGSATVNGNLKYVDGVIDLKDYNIDKNSLVTLRVDSVSTAGGDLNIGSTYTFRMGR